MRELREKRKTKHLKETQREEERTAVHAPEMGNEQGKNKVKF